MVEGYLAPFLIAALMAGGLTYYVKSIAEKRGLADLPSPRKIHTKPVPRLGGVAIFLAFLIVVVGYSLGTHRLEFGPDKILMIDRRLFGVILGALVLVIIGIIDDVRGLSPWKKLTGHLLAGVLVVAFGITIPYIRLGGGAHIDLGNWLLNLNLLGYGVQISVWGDLITVLWIVIAINTMNFLDGLDGLASGISIITAVALFALSFSLSQWPMALLALIFAGSVVGFLPWNFNPAKIFMGDSGSMFLGFMLGVLSVISGGKVATAFLILGIPLLDVLWVILRRIMHKTSPFQADKMHLHHRLLSVGLTQRQAVIVLYLIAIVFGIVAVSVGTEGKIEALFWLFILMGVLIISLLVLEWRRRKRDMEVAK